MDALPTFVVHADEIALDYDDAFQCIAKEESLVPNEVMHVLREIDALFEKMSDDKSMWTIERLRDDETWEKSRSLARLALKSWGYAQGPPDGIGTYVKGL
jgi:hypothetical protein